MYIHYTGCAISSHTPCSPAAHAFPCYFWRAGGGFLGRWGSWGQYNIGWASHPHFIDDGGGATLREYCTTPRAKQTPTHFRRSRGGKDFFFKCKNDARVRAGPGPSKEGCKKALPALMTPYWSFFCRHREKSKKKQSCVRVQQQRRARDPGAHCAQGPGPAQLWGVSNAAFGA